MMQEQHPLYVYNTQSRQKMLFEPLVAGQVKMYVCGMTVYDYCHLGHARVMVVFDMVNRWLRQLGYQVTYVRNITDIDDKIIQRAAERGVSISELTTEYIRYMHEDAAALGVLSPDAEPKATDYVPQMLSMIGVLHDKGLAYQAKNKDVNYAVRNFVGYGKLSGKSLDDLQAGERVEVQINKRDPLDFVLWKSAKAGEPAWASPWGDGRPGWHIECSAMSCTLLGDQFDIHGGGADLQFPHHENEIAQSEGVTGKKLVNYWMHNAFVRVDSEKMSKSLGNFFTIRDVLNAFDAEVVRFFILRAHYRSPLNYSEAHLQDAKQALTRLYLTLNNHPPVDVAIEDTWSSEWGQRFMLAMNDDFATPEAMSVLFDVANAANKATSLQDASVLSAHLRCLAGMLGLLQQTPSAFLQGTQQEAIAGLSHAQIDELISERTAAKQAKNFARADDIRQQLTTAGIVLEDSASGTTWRRQV
jgi:cysteinyl-tRNA synthetase